MRMHAQTPNAPAPRTMPVLSHPTRDSALSQAGKAASHAYGLVIGYFLRLR
jgi:tetrahydromethanopterin S-methyltransferase subunit B